MNSEALMQPELGFWDSLHLSLHYSGGGGGSPALNVNFKLVYVPLALVCRNCRLHALIHTPHLESNLQYLGSSLENAEFLAPLFSSQYLVLRSLRRKCELRDDI